MHTTDFHAYGSIYNKHAQFEEVFATSHFSSTGI